MGDFKIIDGQCSQEDVSLFIRRAVSVKSECENLLGAIQSGKSVDVTLEKLSKLKVESQRLLSFSKRYRVHLQVRQNSLRNQYSALNISYYTAKASLDVFNRIAESSRIDRMRFFGLEAPEDLRDVSDFTPVEKEVYSEFTEIFRRKFVAMKTLEKKMETRTSHLTRCTEHQEIMEEGDRLCETALDKIEIIQNKIENILY